MLYDILKFVHVISFVFMSIPLFNLIAVNERAKIGPFSSTIAHGFLTLSLLPHFSHADASISIKHTSTRINYGLNRLRFVNPVKVDSEIRARFKFIEYTEKNPGQILLTHEVVIEIRNEKKPAMVAEVLTLCILDQ